MGSNNRSICSTEKVGKSSIADELILDSDVMFLLLVNLRLLLRFTTCM